MLYISKTRTATKRPSPSLCMPQAASFPLPKRLQINTKRNKRRSREKSPKGESLGALTAQCAEITSLFRTSRRKATAHRRCPGSLRSMYIQQYTPNKFLVLNYFGALKGINFRALYAAQPASKRSQQPASQLAKQLGWVIKALGLLARLREIPLGSDQAAVTSKTHTAVYTVSGVRVWTGFIAPSVQGGFKRYKPSLLHIKITKRRGVITRWQIPDQRSLGVRCINTMRMHSNIIGVLRPARAATKQHLCCLYRAL